MIDRVTITGADDSIRPDALGDLADRYPFVEWGILFSGSRQGMPRYPTPGWLSALGAVVANRKLTFSAHLCGRWVRDLVLQGNLTFRKEYEALWPMWSRIQLNFHGQYHKACIGFVGALRDNRGKDWIFQHDGVNDGLISTFTQNPNLRAYPLFDRSGGAGAVPLWWPKPICPYQGYAGGLGPDNIVEEIRRIEAVTGDSRIWIDMETRVRSEDDRVFDLGKVERCLELAKPFVNEH